jgi:hypothetical protein
MGRERSWNGFDVNCTQSARTKSGGGRRADFGHNGIAFKLMPRLATMLQLMLTFVNFENRERLAHSSDNNAKRLHSMAVC